MNEVTLEIPLSEFMAGGLTEGFLNDRMSTIVSKDPYVKLLANGPKTKWIGIDRIYLKGEGFEEDLFNRSWKVSSATVLNKSVRYALHRGGNFIDFMIYPDEVSETFPGSMVVGLTSLNLFTSYSDITLSVNSDLIHSVRDKAEFIVLDTTIEDFDCLEERSKFR